MPSAFAYSDSENKYDYVSFFIIPEIFSDYPILVQLTDLKNIASGFGTEESFTDLILYSLGMVMYSVFIWNFYGFYP